METLAGNHLAVKVQFEIGHTSRLRSKKTPEGFTHDWEIYVQGVNKADISTFVEKVVFVLHESFPRPKRVYKDPPYVLQESGYAGFMLPIEIHFRNKEEPKRFQFSYDLDLQQIGPPHHRSEVKNFIFQHPSEELKKKLFQGGGVVVSAIVGNSLQGPPQQMSLNVNLPDGTGSINNLAESPSGGMVSKPKMSSSDNKKHKSSRTDESNTNSFVNLFGPSQNKSKQSPDTKSGSGSNVRNNITQLQNVSGTNSNAANKEKSGKDKEKSSSNSALLDKSRTDKKSDRQKSSPHKEGRSESKKSHDSKQRSSDDPKKDKKDKVRDKDRVRDRDRGEKRALSPKQARENVISPKRLSPQPRPLSSGSGRIEDKKKHETSARNSSKEKQKSSSSSSKRSKKDKKDREREKRDDKPHQNNLNSGSHAVGGELRDINSAYLANDAKPTININNNNNQNNANVIKKADVKDVKGNDLLKSKSSSIINDNKTLDKNSNVPNATQNSIMNNNDRNDNKKEKKVHKHKKKSKTRDKEKENPKDKDNERDREREKDKIKDKEREKDKEKEKEKPKESAEGIKIANNKSPTTKITATATATGSVTVTKSESHKKSSSKEKKIKDRVISSATKIEETKTNNNKKKDLLSTSSVKNAAYNNIDLSDNGDSVLSTTDLNCGITKKIPIVGNQLTDESSNSSFPDLPPKIIASKSSKNSPAQRDVAKTTPTKHQHKKTDKDDSNRKRRRPNSSAPPATNANITATNDVLSPDHAFVEPPTKLIKRDSGKSPASNSPANNSNTTPTRGAIAMNNDIISAPVNTANATALPQPATSPMDTTQQYATISNEYKPKDYMSELQELHNKIMTLQDNEELQRVVELIATTGCYEITSKTFDFDLCKLDRNTVQRLQEHFASSAVS